ncbi:PREDICTED: transcription cofactor vestigial-like protein 1 [Chrysochloris asiatica]|uniref:Transcription cofactor vestigial-like protein 1 n=1 Tax=Chrysochloris asiatica TaxID=185453 RepID=A0A9B0U1Y1_CHRAS|nr:PREDICTED: transcription cofactor vestigial-like protein 1 [Chrysochloris asiatica]
MEETKKTSKGKQKPIRTEWNSRCVLFTYFQGDISSVVDEHFSRALGNIKSPQQLPTSSQNQEVTFRNDSDMPPNQWRLSSHWRKAQPEGVRANGVAKSSLSVSAPMAMDPYPYPHPRLLTRSPSAQPRELWHFPSLPSSSSAQPAYPHAFSSSHLAPNPRPDGKCEPLLSLLQQERCPACPQECLMRESPNSAQIPGRAGLLFNQHPGSYHYKKMYFSSNHGPAASASLATESRYLFPAFDSYSL